MAQSGNKTHCFLAKAQRAQSNHVLIMPAKRLFLFVNLCGLGGFARENIGMMFLKPALG